MTIPIETFGFSEQAVRRKHLNSSLLTAVLILSALLFVVYNIIDDYSAVSNSQRFGIISSLSTKVSNPMWKNPAIPHIIWFTYKDDILKTHKPEEFYNNIDKTISFYRDAWFEPSAPVEFLDDRRCESLILKTDRPRLAHYFRMETSGEKKADICRLAALFLSGGYYFDIDMEVIQPLFLSPTVGFSTVQISRIHRENEFFQSFLASSPKNPIIRKALELTLDVYEGIHAELEPCQLGTVVLWEAFNSIPENDRGHIRLLEENKILPGNYYTLPEERQNGGGCCCNYIVHDPNIQEAYFYSRFVGSGARCSKQI